MIDLLLQVGYILVVLAVISLFVCTLPVWLVVLVIVPLYCDEAGGNGDE